MTVLTTLGVIVVTAALLFGATGIATNLAILALVVELFQRHFVMAGYVIALWVLVMLVMSLTTYARRPEVPHRWPYELAACTLWFPLSIYYVPAWAFRLAHHVSTSNPPSS
jgi:hypothetical protein